MSDITRLLDEYGTLCDSAENKRRLSLWETTDCGLRGETQWHGIPNYTTESGTPMPVTAEVFCAYADLPLYRCDADAALRTLLEARRRGAEQ